MGKMFKNIVGQLCMIMFVVSQVVCFSPPSKVQKTIQALNIVGTLDSAHQNKENSKCNMGCGGCGQGHCFSCYQRPFDGHQQCQSSTVPSNNCELYTYDQPGCTICSTGYMTDADHGNVCIKQLSKIIKCVSTVFTQGMEFCALCQGGFPTFTFQACTPFAGEQVAQNCDVGYYVKGDKACFKCLKGYSVRGTKCVLTPIQGCQILVSNTPKNYCGFCKVEDGWFALNSNGKCIQSQSYKSLNIE